MHVLWLAFVSIPFVLLCYAFSFVPLTEGIIHRHESEVTLLVYFSVVFGMWMMLAGTS